MICILLPTALSADGVGRNKASRYIGYRFQATIRLDLMLGGRFRFHPSTHLATELNQSAKFRN